ncbi:hypothetical protein MNBD_BACTEROID02-1047, partial [hydrothermal vent metagenome]
MNHTIIKFACLIFVLGILSCNTPKEIKDIDLLELTISDIHSAYKDGRYTSEELVSAYIKQIEKFDDSINAISIINPKALTIAKKLDADY